MNATTTCTNQIFIEDFGQWGEISLNETSDTNYIIKNPGVWSANMSAQPAIGRMLCVTSIPKIEWFLLPQVTMIAIMIMFFMVWIIHTRNQWK